MFYQCNAFSENVYTKKLQFFVQSDALYLLVNIFQFSIPLYNLKGSSKIPSNQFVKLFSYRLS